MLFVNEKSLTGDKRKKEYVKLFPTDPKYEKSDEIQIQKLCDNLKKTNKYQLEWIFRFLSKSCRVIFKALAKLQQIFFIEIK